MQATANARTKVAGEAKAARTSVALDNTARATRVLGRRVIDSNTAVILGFVDEIYFHLQTRQITALRVRARWKTRLRSWLKGKKSRWVVPIEVIHSIGAYAVVVDREQAAIPMNSGLSTKAGKKAQPQRKPPAGSTSLQTLLGQLVVTDGGELLGKLSDVLLSDDGFAMQHFEIDVRSILGSRGKPRRVSAASLALSDVLLVPAQDRPATSVFDTAPLAAIAAPAAPPALLEPEVQPTAAQLVAPEWLC